MIASTDQLESEIRNVIEKLAGINAVLAKVPEVDEQYYEIVEVLESLYNVLDGLAVSEVT
jgi:hypothetical protein